MAPKQLSPKPTHCDDELEGLTVVEGVEDFPTLKDANTKRARNSPGVNAPSPNAANNKKVNVNPSPNSQAKASSKLALSSSSALVSSHPFASPTPATSASASQDVSAASTGRTENTFPSPSVPLVNDGLPLPTPAQPVLLPCSSGHPRSSQSCAASQQSKQVSFSASSTQVSYAPSAPVSTPPNGNSSLHSNVPTVTITRPRSQSSSPTAANVGSQAPLSLPGLSSNSTNGVTTQLSSQTPYIVHPPQHQFQNIPQIPLQQPTNHQPQFQIPPSGHQTFYPQYPNSSMFQIPPPYNGPDAMAMALHNAYLMGQQSGGHINHSEVTVSKDKMIAPAQKIKGSLASADPNTTGKSVRQKGYAFCFNVFNVAKLYIIFF